MVARLDAAHDRSLCSELEREWERPAGFLGGLRDGRFSAEGLGRFLAILQGVSADGATLDKRLVALLWYVPIFMEWQRERIAERGGDLQEYAKAQNAVVGAPERILGVP